VRAVLSTTTRALVVGGFLSSLYGFLFVLLQIQDHALLVGSAGLFVILAAVMWLTRRIDWYALAPSKAAGAMAAPK
jgi:inner membrane protein